MQSTCIIWVCQDCMLHHANGECGSCHTDEGHDREPMGLTDPSEVTTGMDHTEHAHGCLFRTAPTFACDAGYECDCETMTFSWSSCEGCGSTLAGERHAMTLWFESD